MTIGKHRVAAGLAATLVLALAALLRQEGCGAPGPRGRAAAGQEPAPVDDGEAPPEPCGAVAHGCVLATLDELAADAERVVVARVVGLRAAWSADRSMIYTHVTLEVRETVRGEAVDRLTIRIPGGEADGVRLDVSHQPRLREGDVALFLLDDDPTLVTPIVGHQQGVLRLTETPRGTALRDGFERTVVGLEPTGGALLVDPHARVTPPGVVDAVKERLRRRPA